MMLNEWQLWQGLRPINQRISLWDPSRGAQYDPRGPTLLLLTVVLLRVLRFLPTLPLLGRGMPLMTWP